MRTSIFAHARRAALLLAPALLFASCLAPVRKLELEGLEEADGKVEVATASTSDAVTAPASIATATAAPRQEDNMWRFEITPYVWGVRTDSEVSSSSLPSPEKLDFDDFEVGYQLRLGAKKGEWKLFADLTFLPLSGSGSTTNLDIVYFELGVQYNLTTISTGGVGQLAIDAIYGNRYYRAESEIDVSGPVLDSDRDWIDIYFGGEARFDITEYVMARARADVGGFDIGGSKLAWQGLIEGGLKLSDTATLLAGYRVIDVEFEDIIGGNPFTFDLQTHGPFAGIALRF